MATYLIRDDQRPYGYIDHKGALPRTRERSYVPWAVTGDRRVVYARFGEHRTRPSRSGLTPYDSLQSKERRKLCQSALGSIALRSTMFSEKGVRKVSDGVKRFLIAKFWHNPEGTRKEFADKVGKYLYGTRYMSFGRISDVAPTGPNANRQIWEESLDALDSGRSLPTILSIHDGVARLMIAPTDKEATRYAKWAAQFRANKAGEMFHDDWRGRQKKEVVTPTTTPGIVTPGNTGGIPEVQLRNRGVDMYNRTAKYSMSDKTLPGASQKASAVTYYQDLDERNELFGAGPSGTTGTILAGAMTFGNLGGDDLKQYLFAIMGYLVGGGMHSLHESLAVMKWLGPEYQMEYNPGSFQRYEIPEGRGTMGKARADDFPALPQSFLVSHQFAEWRDTYYDIVVLGGIHWMFNER